MLKVERWIGTVAVLNLGMIALLSGRPHFSNASRPNPMLAMEMVRNVEEVDAVLGEAPSADREVMRIKEYADFGFIGGYTGLFVLMGMLLVGEGRVIAISAVALGVGAAIFDVIENLAILRIVDVDLGHTTQTMIDAIRYPSLIKWALASLALGLLGILALLTRRPGLRMVGALNVVAALLGLCGLYDHVLFHWFGIPVAGALVGLGILYFRPYYRNAQAA